ncbi:hypothetical protein ACJJTC_004950 [Scirpophaga incertulas]
MIKIIKYGFRPINNDRQRGQNILKGKKLFEAGHVLDVEEKTHDKNDTVITGKLDCNRNITSAICKCKAGQSGKCKHVCALVHYVNSPESAKSKISNVQQWGKPSHRQLLGYDKGLKMSELFPTPAKKPKLLNVCIQLESRDISTATLGESLAITPLYRILQLEEKNEKEIIAVEALVELVKITERKNLNEKIHRIMLDIFMRFLLRLSTFAVFHVTMACEYFSLESNKILRHLIYCIFLTCWYIQECNNALLLSI